MLLLIDGVNMKIYNKDIDIIKYNTNIYGLKYRLKFADYNNDLDWAPFTVAHTQEISQRSLDLVNVLCPGFMDQGIIEIGVDRNANMSFTKALLNNKPDHIPYIGIDIVDKSYLNNSSKNIYTIQASSDAQSVVRNYIKGLNIKTISILFIDGHHSVNMATNDWQYADMLGERGIVFIHDTNSHPGPTIIMEAIDNEKFYTSKFFVHEDDYGLGIAIKK